MPASLVKLVITADNTVGGSITTTTTTNVAPVTTRYVANVTAGMISGGVTTIPATSFLDDTGTALSSGGLPTINANSYYTVQINGVLQQSGLSTLTNNDLVINAAVLVGVPVTLEIVNFSGTTSTSTSTNGVTVSTTLNT
ncbi:DUF4183 domain-containing protein [Priestia taiwanensis]|uniref:DUF4183 domain-containing protein n=1 Tax=Priestia taiwanensis TaxID=1347902 RepID=A0A917AHV8_9BACI|nr:DUF4183 domain-containing protein [Priestia taiwanensis]MBM7361412.1 hypothetical protein [Priestia taiwanensis]GGE53939.1 hypothetical protein GCM10007140_00340 [Priestia taiwanensis]